MRQKSPSFVNILGNVFSFSKQSRQFEILGSEVPLGGPEPGRPLEGEGDVDEDLLPRLGRHHLLHRDLKELGQVELHGRQPRAQLLGGGGDL